jgi:microcystin-dependent protein
MVLRNVAKSFSLEQQRLEINSLASDVHALSQGAVAPTTYTMNPVDGSGPDRKIIRLTGSDGINADVVLVAGTGLSIGLSGGQITFTNSAVETDPVFNASAAANITNTKISNWDTAYGWGDHSTQGYATTSDLNTAVANSSNWDTAYGWGDHSTSGYLTSVAFALNDITDVDTTGVTTGQALIWNAPSSTWIAGTVASSGGGIALTDITVTSLSPGTASLIYDNTSGVFSYTPPDLSGYSTFSGSYNDLINKPTFSVSDLTDVNSTSPSTGQVLKWDGTEWSPAADLTASGTGIALSDISVNVLSVGTANLSYNNTSGVLSYTPPDLSAYSTFSGSYNDLNNKPTLFSGSYTDLTNQPTLFSESYNDLTDKPTLFSESYVDLTNKPTIPSSLNDLIDVLISGTPNDGAVLKYNGTNSRWELGADQNSGSGGGGSGGGGNVAIGSIMMWSGAIVDIPTGWQLCDGTGNSPDLRDRFVVGSGSTYAVGTTGGNVDSTLPSHTHTWSGSGTSNGSTNSQLSNHSHNVSGSGSTNNTGSHDHRWGANTFGGQQGGSFDSLDNPQGNGGGNKSADTSDAGSHSHNVSVTGSTNSSNLSHSHNVSVNVSLSGNTGSQGVSSVGTNLPPYYSLCFIYCTTASGGSSGNPIELDDLTVNVLSVGTADLSYNNTTGLFSYTPPDLSGYSTFSGSYTDLTNQPTLFSESYNDLTDKPTLFSGSYTDLTNKPATSTGYTNSDVDSHLNSLPSPTNGHVLSWNNGDYAWVAQSSGGSSGGSGTTYQWADGVVFSGWIASDLSSEMFDGSLTSWSKAETTSADYLGWDNTANGANLPILNGPVEIFVRYADTANYTYEVNGVSVTPDVSGAVGYTGGWVTLTSGTAGSFKVSTTNTSLNISISGVKSNGLLLTPTALYNDTSGSYENSNVDSHLNVSGASSGQILSWNGSDYAWVADQTGGSGGSGSSDPVGTVVAWAGSVASIPSEYQLCDGGTASTSALQAITGSNVPDLRDRFIVGAGSAYAVNAIGGSTDSITVEHTHAGPDHFHGINTSVNISASGTTGTNDVPHTHAISGTVGTGSGLASGSNYTGDYSPRSTNAATDTNHNHTFSFNTTANLSGDTQNGGNGSTTTVGESGTGKNLPPYYSLCYMIKHTASSGSGSGSGGIALTDISVSVNSPGTAGLSYDNGTGVFTYTPPDLSSGGTAESDTLDSVLSRGATTTRDINTTGKVYFANVFSTTGDLPSASSYHGMFAHVHGTGKGYFAHAGAWVALANESQIANATEWDTAYGWGDHSQAGYSTNNYSQQLIGGSTSVQLDFLSTPVSGGTAGTTSITISAGNNITFSNVSSAGFTIDSAGGSSGGGSGTVTQIDTGTGISGGPITTSGTIELADTGVIAGTYNIPDQITVNGQGQITSLTQGADISIPIGIIVMWSGAASSVPSGWALCNGQTVGSSTTPDLRGMFIVGSGGTYSTGDTGGSESVTLVPSNLASHTHTIASHTHSLGTHSHNVDAHAHNIGDHTHSIANHTHVVGNHSHSIANHSHNFSGSDSGNTGNQSANHSHNISGNTGGGGSHSHSTEFGRGTDDNGPNGPEWTSDWDGGNNANTSNVGNHTHNINANIGNQSSNHKHSFSVSVSGSTSDGGPNYTGNQSANTTAGGGGSTGSASGSSGSSSAGTSSAAVSIDPNSSSDTGNTGGNTAHENRPPYYSLAYIMKV